MEHIELHKKKLASWPQDRIAGFTDGVFAFAITLLILNLIDISIPAGKESLLPFFQQNASSFVSYILTFIIIARFWMSHVRLFAIIKEYDTTTVKLNNALLFFITTFPFTASVLGSHIGNRDAVIMYAACFAIVGILQYSIGRHAFYNKLFITPDLKAQFLKIYSSYTLSTPTIFVISIFVAFISPYLAEALWVTLLFLKIGFRRYNKDNPSVGIEIDEL